MLATVRDQAISCRALPLDRNDFLIHALERGDHVLALYVNSQQVVILYAHPNLLLLVCPLLLYWISRMWLLAHRGQMHDDPVVFALKDMVSYVIAGLALLILWLATGH